MTTRRIALAMMLVGIALAGVLFWLGGPQPPRAMETQVDQLVTKDAWPK